MKIYFASVDVLDEFLKVGGERILFSFYDLTQGGPPFRRIVWKRIIDENLFCRNPGWESEN